MIVCLAIAAGLGVVGLGIWILSAVIVVAYRSWRGDDSQSKEDL